MLKCGYLAKLNVSGRVFNKNYAHTQAYVIFLTEMGGGWVERHLPTVVQRILSLLSNPKTISTHIDAVYSRKCISFILRSVLGQLLGESAQFVAAKHLCQLILQSASGSSGGGGGSLQATKGQRSDDGDFESGDGGMMGGLEKEGKEKDKDKSSSSNQQQHVVICAIIEIGALVFNLNTAALPLVMSDTSGGGEGGGTGRQPPLFAALNKVLLMPQQAARLTGAWCLHCISLALPSQLCYLVGHCLSELKDPKRQTQVTR